MANPIEAARHGLARIAEVTKPVRDYAGDLTNRTIGRAAWMEAMKRPATEFVPYERRPAWSRGLNKALDHNAPAYWALECLVPTTSRLWQPVFHKPDSLANSNSIVITGALLAPLAVDGAFLASLIYLSPNLIDGVAFKLASNVAVHVGLDIASAAVNRFRNHHPNNIILAI